MTLTHTQRLVLIQAYADEYAKQPGIMGSQARNMALSDYREQSESERLASYGSFVLGTYCISP